MTYFIITLSLITENGERSMSNVLCNNIVYYPIKIKIENQQNLDFPHKP
jgi:hypothetical protein